MVSSSVIVHKYDKPRRAYVGGIGICGAVCDAWAMEYGQKLFRLKRYCSTMNGRKVKFVWSSAEFVRFEGCTIACVDCRSSLEYLANSVEEELNE